MDEQEFINYYRNLLILQYHEKPKARGTITALARMLWDNGVFLGVIDGFNLVSTIGSQNYLLQQIQRLQYNYGLSEEQTAAMRAGVLQMYTFPLAVGVQLDILASYVGAYRTYIYHNESTTLTDAQLVKLVQLKAINNSGNHSMSAVVSACVGGFSDALIPLTAGVMVMMYIVDMDVIDEEVLHAALVEDGLPRAMGVRIGYYIERPDAPWFCFTDYIENGFPSEGRQNEWRTGFLTYDDYDERPAQWMCYDQIGGM